jgi:hypothetical protein
VVWLRRVFVPFAAVLLLFTACRVVFAVFNFGLMSDAPLRAWLHAFAEGVRFDLSVLCLVNAPWILLSLLPLPWECKLGWRRALLILFLAVNLPLLLLNLIDVELYAITGRRLTMDLLDEGGGDVWRLLPQFFVHYGHMALASALAGVAIWRLCSPLKETARLVRRGWRQALWLFPVVFAIVLGVRGGLQVKPLSTAHALSVGHGPLSALAQNAPFSLWRTKRRARLRRIGAPESIARARALLRAESGASPAFGRGKGGNMVVVILESFGAEYTSLGGGVSYTPFLDSLMKQGLSFQRHFANGRESIHALPALLAGLPQLMEEPYVRSAYASNPLRGIGGELGRGGYDSAFFHGGQNGTMHFDDFTSLAGFKHYFGLNEYPRREDYDGVWGVPDHLYLPWMARSLSELKPPFLAAVFTLSSHQPYTVPPPYKGRFSKGTLAIHESIGYSDEALRLFFAEAAKQPWYKDTLFVLTADHTQKCEARRFCHEIGRYRVPLVVFRPGGDLPKADLARSTQHTDVFWTLLDWAGVDPGPGLPPFGRSLFRLEDPGTALWRAHGSYVMVRGSRALRLTNKGQVEGPFDADRDWNFDQPLGEARDDLESRLRASIQVFNDGLLGASWHPSR